MSILRARVGSRYRLTQKVTGPDGYSVEFAADDSLSSWWAIVRWNTHFGHWRLVLFTNVPDLFRKVLRRRLWPHSA